MYSVKFLIAIFFIKTLLLAFLIVPLWDVPDETGHFSYVRDLAESRSLPVLKKSVIEADIQNHVFQVQDCQPVDNWIAQHPPLYYFLAVPFYWLGELLTDDKDLLYRSPRIASALSGALTLFVLDKILLQFGLSLLIRLSVVASFASIPMYTLLSSGTNQDTTVALFCSLATLSWVRYINEFRFPDALWCAFWVALAAFTKMTALVFAFALMSTTVLALKNKSSWPQWFLRSSCLAFITLSFPCLWMFRQFIHFGNPFVTYTNFSKWQLDEPLKVSFLEFIEKQPVFEHFFNHFYGLIGWAGTGLGKLHWFQVAGVPYQYFSVVVFLFLVVFVWTYLFELAVSYKIYAFFVAFFVAIGIFIFINIFEHNNIFYHIRRYAFFLLIFAIFIAFFFLFHKNEFLKKTITYSLVISGFMFFVVFWEVYELYLLDGRLRATHGRYFYTLIGIFAVFISFVALKFPISANIFYPILSIALVVAEGYVWLFEAIPFFKVNL